MVVVATENLQIEFLLYWNYVWEVASSIVREN